MTPTPVHAFNVLLTTSQRGVGGVQAVVRDLAAALEQKQRRVFFLEPASLRQLRMTEKVDSHGRRVFSCPLAGLVLAHPTVSVLVSAAFLPLTLVRLTRLLRDHRIDVVNAHYLEPYFLHVVLAARLAGVPVVVSVHGADVDAYQTLSPVPRLFYRLIMRGADRIVGCSRAMAQRTADAFPDAAAKTTYVHNGIVEGGDTAAPSSGPQMPDSSGPQMPERFVLCVCRQVRKKGVDTLLHAFRIVKERGLPHSLVIVGDGPLLDEHVQLAAALGISDRVVFAGKVPFDGVGRYVDACEVFVLPSRDEPFGIAVLEAGYRERAIVCTRVGGLPEIITDGVDGLLVDADDAPGLAAAISRLLADPRERERLGTNARRTVLSRFLWKDRVNDYIAALEGNPSQRLTKRTVTNGVAQEGPQTSTDTPQTSMSSDKIPTRA